MSHSGPSAVEITLSEAERVELVRRTESPHRRSAEKARIILACADGMSNAGVARVVGVQAKTVGTRTDRSMTTARPPTASSATCRTYRECTQSDSVPHPGDSCGIVPGPGRDPQQITAGLHTIDPDRGQLR